MGSIKENIKKIKQYFQIHKKEVLLGFFVGTIIGGILLNILWEYLINPAIEKLIFSFSDKPEIVISMNRLILTKSDEVPYLAGVSNLTENTQFFFATCCNERQLTTSVKIYDSNPSIQIVRKCDTNEECSFDDGEKCYFYTLNIENVGKVAAKSITIYGSTLVNKLDFPKYSPKIKLQTGTGFFNTKEFYAEISDLDVNKPLEITGRSSSISDISLDCEVNGRRDLCFYKIYNLYTTNVVNPNAIIFQGNTIILPQSSFEPKFYQLNQSYLWEEINSINFKMSCDCK